MAAEGQSDTVAFDMEAGMKQRCVVKFLRGEKMAPVDIHWCFLNVYGDQRVDVSIVRQWVVWQQRLNLLSNIPLCFVAVL